jgi:hypothetical protein
MGRKVREPVMWFMLVIEQDLGTTVRAFSKQVPLRNAMSTDDVSGLPSSILLKSQSNARTRQFWDDDSGFWEDPATFLAIDELTLADIKGEPSPANPARGGLPPANLPTGLHIISHSPRIQKDLDRLGIPWGAQYELARGESRGRWKWDDITRVELECLVGRNGTLRRRS